MSRGAAMESRARRVYVLMLVLLAALVGRAGWIQLVRGDELAARARRMHFREVRVPAPRGSILDRHGRPLVASYHSRSLAADPQRIEDPDAFATRIAFLLGEPRAAREFAERIRSLGAEGRRFVYLRRRIDRPVANRIEEAGLTGTIVREEPRREYPHGDLAAAVLGVVGPDEEGHLVGLTGLEHAYDASLRGTDGACSVFKTGSSKNLHLFPECEVAPRPGRDLRTTLDLLIQQIVEEGLDALMERHAPRSACAVALDPRTGEILALAGRPSFDPGAFPDVERENLRIPALQSPYELGSTLKPLIMAWALSCGAVSRGQIIDCGPGHRAFGGRLLHDVKANGRIDLQTVLVKSSNIGMAQVAQAMGVEEARGFLKALGFGRRTGIEIAGEEEGWVTPDAKWSENYTLVSVGMGRELLVTPLQLARAYASLLNGGILVRPTLVRGGWSTAPHRIAYRPHALAFVREAMERVVSREGTGRRARVEGLRIGGKTGTSEDYERPGHYVSSFVGFAPADRPRLLVLVVADDPTARKGIRPYGGVVAAPVVGEILRRALPFVENHSKTALPESGVRHSPREMNKGKVRVAAVHRSSVRVGGEVLPAHGRNPDSAGAAPCPRGAR